MFGELLRIIGLIEMMLLLYVDNWDITHIVSFIYILSQTFNTSMNTMFFECCLKSVTKSLGNNSLNKSIFITLDVRYKCCAWFGVGTGPIHIGNLACVGSEYRIRDCRNDNNTLEDSHNEDWGVYCYVG